MNSSSRYVTRIAIACSVVCALVTAEGSARAEFDDIPVCEGKIVTLVVGDRGGSVTVPGHPSKITTFAFPHTVLDTHYTKEQFYVKQMGDDRVEVKPLGAPYTNVQVHMLPGAVSIDVKLTTKPDKVPGFVEVITRSEAERRKAEAIDRTLRQIVYDKDVNLHSTQSESSESLRRSGTPHATVTRTKWLDGEQYVEFDFINGSLSQYELAGVEIEVNKDKRITIERVFLDQPEDRAKGLFSTIPPETISTGALWLPDSVDAASIDTLHVSFTEPNGMRPVVAAAQRIHLVPIPPKELERDDLTKQIAVSLRILGGAFFIGDNTGQNVIDSTHLTGLGVRVSKGLAKLWAFEAELLGARSGEASFANVNWQGMDGDLVRQASLARVLFGGALRLGDKISPTVRLGVGGQIASHDSSFTTNDGTSMDGPGNSLEFDLLWSVGAGIDVRLGKSWVVGGALSGIGVAKSLSGGGVSGSFEAGVHIGYGWNP